jgi:hypothetical protein
VVSRLPPPTERPIQTRFRFGSAAERLNLAGDGKSPDHYAKGTRSPCPLPGIGLSPLVGMWFQVHYPPLVGVLPIFRSRYLFAIGRQGVLSLTGWMGPVDSDALPRVASYSGAEPIHSPFAYGTFTLYGRTFQNGLARVADRCVRSYNPTRASPGGLGWSAFARRYLRSLG